MRDGDYYKSRRCQTYGRQVDFNFNWFMRPIYKEKIWNVRNEEEETRDWRRSERVFPETNCGEPGFKNPM